MRTTIGSHRYTYITRTDKKPNGTRFGGGTWWCSEHQLRVTFVFFVAQKTTKKTVVYTFISDTHGNTDGDGPKPNQNMIHTKCTYIRSDRSQHIAYLCYSDKRIKRSTSAIAINRSKHSAYPARTAAASCSQAIGTPRCSNRSRRSPSGDLEGASSNPCPCLSTSSRPVAARRSEPPSPVNAT